MKFRPRQNGFTLLETMIAIVAGTIVVSVLASVLQNLMDTRGVIAERSRLTHDARFAMERMSRAVQESRVLILPQPDKASTNWRENVREQTVPESPPEGDSTKATAVLAVSLSSRFDLNNDGFPDADNDKDGLIDEDFPDDISNDNEPGLYLIDDDGDGEVDGGPRENDDETGNDRDEDPVNGLDDDGDGVLDEDPSADVNNDNQPGVAGVDDDGDGQVDEGNKDDDDEDGTADEDWLDAVVYYLVEDELIERHPVPWDESSSDGITGRDFIESTIAEGVSRFRVERIIGSSGGSSTVDITLELTGSTSADVMTLHTRVRVGSAQ